MNRLIVSHVHAAPAKRAKPPSARLVEVAAGFFRAIGDVERLRLLTLLLDGERCVTEIAEALDEGLSTVSQRLRILRAEAVVARRRSGKHVLYRLADSHVEDLMRTAIAHAAEHGKLRNKR